MYEWLIEPWVLGDWMWRGTLATTLVAIPSALLGVFLYLRRMSLVADALTHVAVLGITVTFLVTGSVEPATMLLGAVIVGVLTTAMMQKLSSVRGVRGDAAIGIVFTAAFALGVILLSMFVRDAHIDTSCMLFGDVLGISNDALVLLGFVAPLVCVVVALGYRWLAAVSFDPVFARNLGIPVALVHYGLMTGVSVTSVAAFEAVGAILAVAMIVVPAAFAHLLADRLPTMLMFAVLHGIVSSVLGMYVAIALDVSAAGAIVCTGGALYFGAMLLAPRHGWLARTQRKRRGRTASRGAT